MNIAWTSSLLTYNIKRFQQPMEGNSQYPQASHQIHNNNPFSMLAPSSSAQPFQPIRSPIFDYNERHLVLFAYNKQKD